VGSGLRLSVAAAFRGMPAGRMPAGAIPGPCRRRAAAAKAKVWLGRRTGILPANGSISTTPVAPGRVDFRPRPRPTQVAALCLGST